MSYWASSLLIKYCSFPYVTLDQSDTECETTKCKHNYVHYPISKADIKAAIPVDDDIFKICSSCRLIAPFSLTRRLHWKLKGAWPCSLCELTDWSAFLKGQCSSNMFQENSHILKIHLHLLSHSLVFNA